MGPSKAGADKVTVGDSDFKAGQSVMAPLGLAGRYALSRWTQGSLHPCIHAIQIAQNGKMSMFTGLSTGLEKIERGVGKAKVFAGRCR